MSVSLGGIIENILNSKVLMRIIKRSYETSNTENSEFHIETCAWKKSFGLLSIASL